MILQETTTDKGGKKTKLYYRREYLVNCQDIRLLVRPPLGPIPDYLTPPWLQMLRKDNGKTPRKYDVALPNLPETRGCVGFCTATSVAQTLLDLGNVNHNLMSHTMHAPAPSLG